MNSYQSGFGLFLVVAFAACGGAAPPNERLIESESAIRSAREVGAHDVPKAQLHVKLAEEQTQKARELMMDDQHERADLVLQRAIADAELAIALAKKEDKLVRVSDAKERIDEAKQAAQ